jgi:hypothetical protein
VDAHNRFGGRDRVRFSATMKTNGDGWKVENLRGWTAR